MAGVKGKTYKRNPYVGIAKGSANALSVKMGGPGYYDGQEVTLVAGFTNTNATVTLSIDKKEAKTIKKNGTTALALGDIVIGKTYDLKYDGTYFQLLNPTTTASGGIEEAPEDGKTYGRKDAAWSEVASGGSVLSRVMLITYDRATGTGSVVYNHPLGVVPKSISFNYSMLDTREAPYYCVVGFSDGINNYTQTHAATVLSIYQDNDGCINVSENPGVTGVSGKIIAWDDTTFTIQWTKSGSPTGTISAIVSLIG